MSSSAASGAAVPTPEPGADDELRLIDALKQVVDPELMINIIDLGLVYSINRDAKKIYVEMTLTS
ncbi:MAG TPA: iron-sulfur cluster assembly protein, partial [Planctomycetaceae bacterium]|nr:iron-sulfur cluster assembly protein [Planctomycetaceae bacterium]